MQDIVRSGPVPAKFTKRRMFENYLFNIRAIVQVMNGCEGFRPHPVTEQEVDAWMEANRGDSKYYCSQEPAFTKNDWLVRIDGAAFLEDLFSQLSDSRVPYRKVYHGLALTERIAADSPDDFKEIADLIVPLLENT